LEAQIRKPPLLRRWGEAIVHGWFALKVATYANPVMTRAAVGRIKPKWKKRIADVVDCPDNAFIPRVAEAGRLERGWITMHNGIQVGALGYYGSGVLNMLMQNRGVHEPQEERAFGEVLRSIPAGGAMVELGAYWGFYSLWFNRAVPQARSFLIEPKSANIESGRRNFRHNGASAEFERAFVGAAEKPSLVGAPTISVDGFCRRRGFERLAMLHSDIQGAEVAMLEGACDMLGREAIDYVFISTHSNELHRLCTELLVGHGYRILASADLQETYSHDGLLVACSSRITAPSQIEISVRSSAVPRR